MPISVLLMENWSLIPSVLDWGYIHLSVSSSSLTWLLSYSEFYDLKIRLSSRAYAYVNQLLLQSTSSYNHVYWIGILLYMDLIHCISSLKGSLAIWFTTHSCFDHIIGTPWKATDFYMFISSMRSSIVTQVCYFFSFL